MSVELISVPKTSDAEVAAREPLRAASTQTLIRPPRGWQLLNVGELWRYRELLYFLAWRDVKVRYKQTVLGAAWAVLQPALMMVVFSIFFGRMAHVDSGGIPYPLFAFAGLLPWTFFATAIANAGNSVVGSERLITKVYFPRLAIPFASVAAALIDFAVAFSMMAGLMVWYRVAPTWGLLFVPILVALLTIAALGVGALLAALNVAYRDFRYVIPFLVQLWMFATPSVYMQTDIESGGTEISSGVNGPGDTLDRASREPATQSRPPEVSQFLLTVNPLTGLISSFRAAVLQGQVSLRALAVSSAGAVVMFIAGCFYFRRVEDSFADII